jgi:hypothetical protein
MTIDQFSRPLQLCPFASALKSYLAGVSRRSSIADEDRAAIVSMAIIVGPRWA